MAYVIQFLKNGNEKRDKVYSYLQDRIAKDGRFRCSMELGEEKTTRSDRAQLGKIYSAPCIRIRRVRLTKKKPYCGQHFGECVVNPFLGPRKKPSATYLEWNDWVAFHKLVNTVLNKYKTDANVWTNPMEGGVSKMWIRRGTKARLKWDVTETFNNYGRRIQIWNEGTPDQFLR